VFQNRVHDAKRIREYLSKVGETMAPYYPQILVLDENAEVIEGDTNLPRTIVMKFDSRDAAMAWYTSPAYQKVLFLRLEATEGYAVLVDSRQ
jgi:uncharacterized protein (DUF1330 family)